MKNSRIGIIILLLLLAIGFASVTTNLIINNHINISARPDDFVVYFSKAVSEEGGTATISNDKKIITYSTKELMQVGDRAELDYRVTNDSPEYDANISLDITIDNNYSNYFNISYITFDNSNSTLVEAKSSKEGKIIIELLKPFVEDMNISFVITLDVEAVGRDTIAEPTYYTLLFDSKGGTPIESKSIEAAHTYGELSSPTKNGFIFAGWYKNGVIVDDNTTIDSNNETLEASWERGSYNLTIDLAGGTSSQQLNHSILYEDTLTLVRPTRDNYIFLGWTSNKETTTLQGDVVTMGYEDTTITATWMPSKYYVRFNGNESTSGSMPVQEITYDQTTTLNANQFARTNYTFAGWSRSASSLSAEYINQDQILNLVNDGSTVDLYAVWVVTVTNYGYAASIRTYAAPTKGIYKLEVWGARGGNISGYNGGKGGYSVGEIELAAGTKLSIGTGGVGNGATAAGQSLSGGYNGGGSVTGNSGVNHITASGGGATHIAIYNSSYGTLQSYSSKSILDQYVLIVAGGGGGARDQANHVNAARWGHGGAGGGVQSSGAYSSAGTTTVAKRNVCIANQTAGYRYGLGESCNGNSAGGGGYMGGYAGNSSCGYYGTGHGGSGYIAKLSNAASYDGEKTFKAPGGSNETGHNGNGYARITFIRGTK